MRKSIDLTGQKYNHLTVLGFYGNKRHPSGRTDRVWKCKCDCGNTVVVSTKGLRHGGTKSCGCINYRILPKHGLRNTRLYTIWSGMKKRCFSISNKNYDHYGGRGITVCDEWLGENGFVNFYNWAINNGYSDDLTLDRINVSGNYEPSNCRWATLKEQANNKQKTKKYEFQGESHSLGEWADITGKPYMILYRRIKKFNWSIERALTEPII